MGQLPKISLCRPVSGAPALCSGCFRMSRRTSKSACPSFTQPSFRKNLLRARTHQGTGDRVKEEVLSVVRTVCVTGHLLHPLDHTCHVSRDRTYSPMCSRALEHGRCPINIVASMLNRHLSSKGFRVMGRGAGHSEPAIVVHPAPVSGRTEARGRHLTKPPRRGSGLLPGGGSPRAENGSGSEGHCGY